MNETPSDAPPPAPENPFKPPQAPPSPGRAQGLTLGCLILLAIPASIVAFFGACTGTFFIGATVVDAVDPDGYAWFDALFAIGPLLGVIAAGFTIYGFVRLNARLKQRAPSSQMKDDRPE